MRLGVLFSGGKDSFLAMIKAIENSHSIGCLITIVPENKESFMFHVPNIELADTLAKAIGFKLVKVRSKGEKEKELNDLKKAIQIAMKRYNIEGVVTGTVRSTYQATRIQRICNELDIWCFNPLWLRPQLDLLEEIIRKRIKVIITGIAAYPLSKEWLGREIDKQFIEDVKELEKVYRINPAGEGGEFETMVLDSPYHRYSIKIIEAEKNFSNYYGVYSVKKVRLMKK